MAGAMIRRRSPDLPARQLHNITEEMALAAGVPAPALYLWPTPGVINAFAIGHTTADAAIFVSKGAIDALSRDEMQALIGHRMSQVLNGDMALNSRLASYLYAFRFAPRVAKWWLFFPTHDEEILERIKATLVWLFFALWVGLALSIVTFPQYVGARLLQAAISRERQRLADASAIQFTRNPEALKGVLIKALALGTISPGTPMLMDDLAQTCFAAPVKRRYLDTHQTLAQRLRQLDAKLTPAKISTLSREAFEEVARRKEITSAELERQKLAAAERKQAAVAREKFAREVAAVAARPARAKRHWKKAALRSTRPTMRELRWWRCCSIANPRRAANSSRSSRAVSVRARCPRSKGQRGVGAARACATYDRDGQTAARDSRTAGAGTSPIGGRHRRASCGPTKAPTSSNTRCRVRHRCSSRMCSSRAIHTARPISVTTPWRCVPCSRWSRSTAVGVMPRRHSKSA
jgi:Zn-dependent protease with chaperone function